MIVPANTTVTEYQTKALLDLGYHHNVGGGWAHPENKYDTGYSAGSWPTHYAKQTDALYKKHYSKTLTASRKTIPEKDKIPDIHSYDKILLAISGGKDSNAFLLRLLEMGVDVSKLEIWHHEIDGRETDALMDWPCTPDYTRALAKAFNIPIYFSWRMGGLEREMLRENSNTAPVKFELPDGTIGQSGGTRHSPGTRRKFPSVEGNLLKRWCSSVLKIDVMGAAIRNQDRFKFSRTLVITGERHEESPKRAKYEAFGIHRDDARKGVRTKRHIDHWRPVLYWKEAEVWDIIKRWNINPHPSYRLSWGRCSCAYCIFGSHNMWKSMAVISETLLTAVGVPNKIRGVADRMLKKIISYEEDFGWTIHRKLSVPERIAIGKAFDNMKLEDMIAAFSSEFNEPIFIEDWQYPAGAFGENAGPS